MSRFVPLCFAMQLLSLPGCPAPTTDVDPASDTTGGSTGATASTVQASTSADSSDSSAGSTSSATSTSDASEDSSGGTEPADPCPPGTQGMEAHGIWLDEIDEDWPWDPDAELIGHADCVPMMFDGEQLAFECTPPEGGPQTYTLRVVSNFEGGQDALSEVFDEISVTLSFLGPVGFTGGGAGTIFSIRSDDGRLLVLAYNSTGLGGDTLFSASFWGSEWTLPFEDIGQYYAGCEARAAVRPFSDAELPMVIEFGTDRGPVPVFDRQSATLEAGGELYTAYVFDAYEQLEGCTQGGPGGVWIST